MKHLMKHLTAGLLMCAALAGFASSAHAGCAPSSIEAVRFGIVSDSAKHSGGAWAYWWCTNTGELTFEWHVVKSSAITPALLASLSAFAAGKNPDLLKTPPTLKEDDPSLAGLKAAMRVAMKADQDRPVMPMPKYVVAPFHRDHMAPAYAMVGGVRAQVATSSVPVGTVCGCTLRPTSSPAPTGSGAAYCMVSTQPLPVRVAVCIKAPA